jgi:hypothetical protein
MIHDKALSSTSQLYLDIYDISNDLVILKDGAVSIILTVTAMNFGLLAEEEQDAIIYGYAGLLNSLNYPIQILIRSQTKDVTSYLNVLKLKEEETMNRMKKDQIRRYREFITDLVKERNVLDKKFYVVIPATALELGLVSTQSVIPGVKTADVSTFDRSVILERAKNLLEPKRDHIMAQFARIGLYSRQLKTQEIIQLFYTIYNPEASDGQKMTDSRNYTTALVEGNLEQQVFGGNRSKSPENISTQKPFHFPETNQASSDAQVSPQNSFSNNQEQVETQPPAAPQNFAQYAAPQEQPLHEAAPLEPASPAPAELV